MFGRFLKRGKAAADSQSLAAAREHHQAGRLDEAERIYLQILASAPADFDAQHLLGVIALQRGDQGRAVKLISQAIRKAGKLRPDQAAAQFHLGNALRELGKGAEAKAAYRAALSLQFDLGAVHVNLGNLCREDGDLQEALGHYEEAARLLPRERDPQLNLGQLLHQLGHHSRARAAFEKALAIDPRCGEAALALAIALTDLARHDDAARWFTKASTVDPQLLAPRWAHACAQLAPVSSSADEMGSRRARFSAKLNELEQWVAGHPVQDAARAVGSVQPFLLAYYDEPNRELLGRYGTLCARLMAGWQKERRAPSPAPAVKGARLRVGIASAQVRDHSVWNAIARGWLAHLDPKRFELHVFHLGLHADQETTYARSRASHFYPGPRTLEQWADQIASRQLHALIYPEVGMDPTTLQLASLRLAPVQAASWGHPETTGLPTIDFYLSAEDLEPPGAQENYTEKLIALPRLGCAYSAYRGAVAAPGPGLLEAQAGDPVLLCPGLPQKYTPANDAPLVEIAGRLGRCRLVFFTHERLPHLSLRLQARVGAAFKAAGLEADRFLVFLPWQPQPAFRGLMERADVYLDTIGFSGFNTAMQALECALPVVTHEGRFLRGRLASGLLRRADLSDLVVQTGEAYVELAVRLASDETLRRHWRSRIATARAALYDDRESVDALGRFLAKTCGNG